MGLRETIIFTQPWERRAQRSRADQEKKPTGDMCPSTPIRSSNNEPAGSVEPKIQYTLEPREVCVRRLELPQEPEMSRQHEQAWFGGPNGIRTRV
ncbi:hypothetical protein, partial [Petrachloros mirabilis]